MRISLSCAGFGAFLMILSRFAFADMDVPVEKATAYAPGHCQYDKYGGGKQTATGDDPTQHTVQIAKSSGTFASAAVPQAGGNAGIFKCEFTDEQNYPGITFHADDHYDNGSVTGISADGKAQYDAAWDCVPEVKTASKPASVLMVKGTCGGVRGGAGDTIKRGT